MGNKVTSISLLKNDIPQWTMDGEYQSLFALGFVLAGNRGISLTHGEGYTWELTGQQFFKSIDDIRTTYMKYETSEPGLGDKLCEHAGYGYNIWIKEENAYALYCVREPWAALEFLQGIITAANAFHIKVSDVVVRTPMRVSIYEGRKVFQFKDIDGHPTQRYAATKEELEERCNRDRVVEAEQVRLDRMRQHTINKGLEKYQPGLVDETMRDMAVIIKYIPQENDIEALDDFIGYRGTNNNVADEYLIETGYKE